MTLASVALMVALGIVLLAGSLAPLLLFGVQMVRDFDDEWHPGWRLWALSSVVSFACIVLAVWLIQQTGSGPAAEAAHCGPGTHYVSQDHLIGKTITHDWACVA